MPNCLQCGKNLKKERTDYKILTEVSVFLKLFGIRRKEEFFCDNECITEWVLTDNNGNNIGKD